MTTPTQNQDVMLTVLEDIEGRLMRLSKQLRTHQSEVVVMRKILQEVRRTLYQEFHQS